MKRASGIRLEAEALRDVFNPNTLDSHRRSFCNVPLPLAADYFGWSTLAYGDAVVKPDFGQQLKMVQFEDLREIEQKYICGGKWQQFGKKVKEQQDDT